MGESSFEQATSQELLETLRDAQRLGFFGRGDVEAMAAHARLYLPPLRPLPSGSQVCDLGSGGGLPALVVAAVRPDLSITMVDRRRKRTDFLERARRRLGMENVIVMNLDIASLVRDVESGRARHFDGVTARGFGPPKAFLDAASGLLDVGGVAVISEPPDGREWSDASLAERGLRRSASTNVPDATPFDGGVQTFVRTDAAPNDQRRS